jgi:hypothetical protein
MLSYPRNGAEGFSTSSSERAIRFWTARTSERMTRHGTPCVFLYPSRRHTRGHIVVCKACTEVHTISEQPDGARPSLPLLTSLILWPWLHTPSEPERLATERTPCYPLFWPPFRRSFTWYTHSPHNPCRGVRLSAWSQDLDPLSTARPGLLWIDSLALHPL